VLAHAENRAVLRQDSHASARNIGDPPFVALLATLHLRVDVVLEDGGDAVVRSISLLE